MSSTEMSDVAATDASGRAVVRMPSESTTLPATGANRAPAVYRGLGWRLDADCDQSEKGCVIQFTPPCAASIRVGRPTKIARGFREERITRGVDATEVWHACLGQTPAPGRDPDGRSYVSFPSFADPDGDR